MGEILEDCPKFFPALLYRGLYYLSIGEDDKGIKFYDTIFAVDI